MIIIDALEDGRILYVKNSFRDVLRVYRELKMRDLRRTGTTIILPSLLLSQPPPPTIPSPQNTLWIGKHIKLSNPIPWYNITLFLVWNKLMQYLTSLDI